MTNDKINWLRLIRTHGIGCQKFWQLIHHFDTFDQIFSTLRQQDIKIPDVASIEQEIARCAKRNVGILYAFEDHFPRLLRESPLCPPVLFYQGNLDLLSKDSIGIVGARNASIYGLRMAESLAADLAACGFVIVSGFARGIDKVAHQCTLHTGTIGVFAGGIDVIFPPENTELYHQLIAKGLVLSEQPLGTKPLAFAFPVRNRIIAGLVKGLVIIEAAFGSGSLITANTTVELNKDVFVVPGHPMDPRSRGGNHLLKQGAILVENAQDIINHYGLSHAQKPTKPKITKTEVPHSLKEKLCTYLSHTPLSVDELAVHIQCDTHALLSVLSELEIEGKIQRDTQGKVYLG